MISEGAASEPTTISLPRTWQTLRISDERGQVRLQRAFNRPSHLDPHERVWLVCEPTGARGFLQCNGHTLGKLPPDQAAEWEITPHLANRNEVALQLDVPLPIAPQPVLGDVRLEIRERQFLADWAVWVESTGAHALLRIDGIVTGEPAETALELIVRGPHDELLYATVSVGERFSLQFACALPLPEMLSVRLLRSGTRIWQAEASIGVKMDGLRD